MLDLLLDPLAGELSDGSLYSKRPAAVAVRSTTRLAKCQRAGPERRRRQAASCVLPRIPSRGITCVTMRRCPAASTKSARATEGATRECAVNPRVQFLERPPECHTGPSRCLRSAMTTTTAVSRAPAGISRTGDARSSSASIVPPPSTLRCRDSSTSSSSTGGGGGDPSPRWRMFTGGWAMAGDPPGVKLRPRATGRSRSGVAPQARRASPRSRRGLRLTRSRRGPGTRTRHRSRESRSRSAC